ncbi:MAG: alpha/beta hydrolase [Flavitalea sp.]
MHEKKIFTAGKELNAGNKVLILLHGRGGSAEDIVSLAGYLNVADFTIIAPEATNNTWYPFSFMAPPAQNEPWLSSALELINDVVNNLKDQGISTENIYFAGFSQGACLTLEYVSRNAMKYGGVVAFTGGLIGDKIYQENYKGDFKNTPVFIGTSDPDPHIPVGRVHASTNILQGLNAQVVEKIYNNMGHTINQDEIDQANTLIFPAPESL